jgi:hypothetical protein
MWAQSEAVSPLAHLILIPPDLDARCARNLVRLSAQGLAKHMHSIQHLQRFLFSILLATGLLSVSASAQCVPQWSPVLTSAGGMDAFVLDLTTLPNGDVVAGGLILHGWQRARRGHRALGWHQLVGDGSGRVGWLGSGGPDCSLNLLRPHSSPRRASLRRSRRTRKDWSRELLQTQQQTLASHRRALVRPFRIGARWSSKFSISVRRRARS